MRTPSFVSQSRAPAAFGVSPAGRVRPAGDAIDQDPSCATSTYHNVQFYDISHTCMNTTHDLSGVQLYNVFGYPIDRYGSPMTGGAVPPAPWAQLGTQGEAWYEPNSSMMLDANGDPIGQAQFNAYAKGGMQATTPTTPIRPGVTQVVPAAPRILTPMDFISQNSMVIAGIAVVAIVGFLVLSGGPKVAATEPMMGPSPGLARARSPRRSARTRR